MLIYRYLLNLLSNNSKRMIGYLLITLVAISFLEILTLLTIVMLSNRLFQQGSTSAGEGLTFLPSLGNELTTVQLIVLFSILSTCVFAVRTLHSYFSTAGIASIGTDLSGALFGRFFSTRLENLQRFATSEVTADFQRVTNFVFGILVPFIQAISAALISVVLVLSALIISPNTVGVILALISLAYVLMLVGLRKVNKKLGEQIDHVQASRLSMIESLIGMSREYRLSEQFSNTSDIFSRVERHYLRSQGLSQFLSTYPRYVMEYIVIVIIIAYGYITFVLADRGFMELLSDLVALFYVAQKVIPNAQLMYFTASKIQNNFPQLNTLLADLDLISAGYKIKPGLSRFSSLKISGKKMGSSEYRIFEIKAGDWVRIFGRSGSGKSSLIDFILGLKDDVPGYAFTCSSINIKERDGINVSYASGKGYLVNGSVFSNVVMNWPQHSLGGVDAEQAIVDTLIDDKLFEAVGLTEMPGTDPNSSVDARIASVEYLSSGQKQRVILARALLSRPDFLVIDEGTSALDPAAEEKLLVAIKTLFPNITLLFVSHRSSANYLFNSTINLDDM